MKVDRFFLNLFSLSAPLCFPVFFFLTFGITLLEPVELKMKDLS